jgi:hypothetical protein
VGSQTFVVGFELGLGFGFGFELGNWPASY